MVNIKKKKHKILVTIFIIVVLGIVLIKVFDFEKGEKHYISSVDGTFFFKDLKFEIKADKVLYGDSIRILKDLKTIIYEDLDASQKENIYGKSNKYQHKPLLVSFRKAEWNGHIGWIFNNEQRKSLSSQKPSGINVNKTVVHLPNKETVKKNSTNWNIPLMDKFGNLEQFSKEELIEILCKHTWENYAIYIFYKDNRFSKHTHDTYQGLWDINNQGEIKLTFNDLHGENEHFTFKNKFTLINANNVEFINQEKIENDHTKLTQKQTIEKVKLSSVTKQNLNGLWVSKDTDADGIRLGIEITDNYISLGEITYTSFYENWEKYGFEKKSNWEYDNSSNQIRVYISSTQYTKTSVDTIQLIEYNNNKLHLTFTKGNKVFNNSDFEPVFHRKK